MKKLFKISICILLTLPMVSAMAQSFEGVITYEISYDNLPKEMAEYESMLPKESISTIKGHMYKMEQPSTMGMKQVTIMDNEAESGILLMEMMGKKSAIVLDKESREKFEKDQPEPEITYVDETKEIAGYTCKKALVQMPESQGSGSLEVYYTDKILDLDMNQVKGLKGFPLQYTANTGQFLMTMTAQSVDKKKISEEEFVVPEGYEHITMEEFQKTFGGQ